MLEGEVRVSDRLRIAVDMDEVMADLVSAWLARYLRDFATGITPAMLRGRNFVEAVDPDHAVKVRAYLEEPFFFADLPVMENSQEVLQKLNKDYEIFVTTAAMDHPNSFAAKYAWLRRHFPFLSDRHYVFCGSKSVIRADYMIDDNPRNLESFYGRKLLYTAHHNIGVQDHNFIRVSSWRDILNFFSKEASTASSQRYDSAHTSP
jgi:5'(3')-deoxyribonucleotidase